MNAGRSRNTPAFAALLASLLRARRAIACFVVLIVIAGSSQAVLIAAGDGTGNTTPPSDDPGFGKVGTIGFESAVYLGNGWVITANHIGSGPLVLGGVTYPMVNGSKHQLTTPGVGPADLALVKFDGDPGLSNMNIATSSPPNNGQIVMIGDGKNRGVATTWTDVNNTVHNGWPVAPGNTIRWGNNRIAGFYSPPYPLDTIAYVTEFNASGGTTFECQAVGGDSGGAVFYKRAGTWELSGIMFATSVYPDQPPGLALYGNYTLIADLSVYRPEILTVINTPTCSDGLDDDGDGLIDYPADPGCSSASDDDERDANLVCDDGLDNDGDGLFDWPADPGCDDSMDGSEQSPLLICDDGLDNEGDGFTDYPEDPECISPTTPSEGPGPYVPVTSTVGAALLMLLLGGLGGRGRMPA